MKFVRFIVSIIFFTSAIQIFAQTENFDLATFTAPKDFKREQREKALAFSKVNESNGKFCIIGIYPSRQSSGSLETDFQTEWQERVGKTLSTKIKPEVQKFDASAGWEGVLGTAKIESNGAAMVMMLAVHRGYNRVMSVLISINSLDYQTDYEHFLKSLKMNSLADSLASNNSDLDASQSSSPNGIVGSWGDVGAGDFNVRNSSGNVSTGRGDTALNYSFKSDGTYVYSMLADIALNGTKIFIQETGTYKTSGNNLILIPKTSVYKRNGVNEEPRSDWRNQKKIQWRIEKDGAITELILNNGNSEDRLRWNR